MNLVKIFAKGWSYFHGYQVKRIRDAQEYKAVQQLKRKVYQQMYQIKPLSIPDTIKTFKDETYIVGVYHRQQLIGAAHLLDLSQNKSVVEQLYSKNKFEYSPKDTYEFGGLIIDQEHQGKGRDVFYLLMAYTHWYTLETNRKKWLVSSNKRLFSNLQRMGLSLEFISDNFHIKESDTIQYQVLKNDFPAGRMQNCCCFYAFQPENLARVQLQKFLIIQFKRVFSKNKNKSFKV